MTGSLGWLLVAVAGLVIAAGALVVLRTRLSLTVPEDRRTRRTGWQLGLGPLAGVGFGIFLAGAGVGGALARIQLPSWNMPMERVVDLTPEPMEELEEGWEEAGVEPSAVPPSEAAQPDPEAAVAGASRDSIPAPGAGLSPPLGDTTAPAERLIPRFAVRAGVFRDRENAEALQEELRGAGYPPLLVPREDNDGAVVFWVYAGMFATRESADVAVRELSRRGVQAMVVNASEVEEGG